MWVLLITIVLLCFLAYQDFRFRAISWWLIPLLLVCFVGKGMSELSWQTYLLGFGVNLTFVAIQLLVVFLYFSLKQRKLIRLVNEQIGLGDILFFVVMAAAFSPLYFVLVYTISLLLVLLFWLSSKLFLNRKNALIPLAGGQSLVVLIALIVGYWIPAFNPLTSNYTF